MLSHAPASLTIPTRSFGVFEAPTFAAFITPIRLALRSTPSHPRASIGAVALTTIASSTEIGHYAAASAKKTADRLLHRRTTLDRRATSHAALMLHSGGFSDVFISQSSAAIKRGLPHCCGPCPLSVSLGAPRLQGCASDARRRNCALLNRHQHRDRPQAMSSHNMP